MESKINHLLKMWPQGTVATSSWLQEQGVSRQLARRYTESGWLQRFGHGAFVQARESSMVEWSGAVYALQHQQGLSLHPAAASALSLLGLGHYLPLGGKEAVTLFSDRPEKLPTWFTRHEWPMRLAHHTPKLFDSYPMESLTEVSRNGFSIRVSAPEQAILELFHLATTNDAITHALEFMNGLNTLRPQVVQSLLETCRSVKVKRLFLWASESAGHDWFSRLTPDRINLGKGKRSLYRGGRFDKKYLITVPRQEETAHV